MLHGPGYLHRERAVGPRAEQPETDRRCIRTHGTTYLREEKGHICSSSFLHPSSSFLSSPGDLTMRSSSDISRGVFLGIPAEHCFADARFIVSLRHLRHCCLSTVSNMGSHGTSSSVPAPRGTAHWQDGTGSHLKSQGSAKWNRHLCACFGKGTFQDWSICAMVYSIPCIAFGEPKRQSC